MQKGRTERPALRAFGLKPVRTASWSAGGGGEGRERDLARNALVVAQMSLAFALLTGSGLMVRSFHALRTVDPGVAAPEEVLSFRPLDSWSPRSDDGVRRRLSAPFVALLNPGPGKDVLERIVGFVARIFVQHAIESVEGHLSADGRRQHDWILDRELVIQLVV